MSSSKHTRTLVVRSPQGLHLRPAAMIRKLLQDFSAEVTLIHGTVRADATSVIGLLSLVASPGAELQAEADGDDAPAALDALESLFADGFGEGTSSTHE